MGIQLFFNLFVVLFSFSSFAQTSETISSGRPGQAIGSDAVGRGLFQVQSGVDFYQNSGEQMKSETRASNNVLRFGLSETFELRSIIDYQWDDSDQNGVQSHQQGISNMQVGFRFNVVDEADGWIPMFAIQNQFALKQVGNAYRPDQVASSVKVSMTHNLHPDLKLTTNLALAYDGETNIPRYDFVFSLTQSFTDTWSTVYEFYGNEYDDKESQYVGFGVAYLVNNDFQIDTYISSGRNNRVDEFYGTVGLSWRTRLF